MKWMWSIAVVGEEPIETVEMERNSGGEANGSTTDEDVNDPYAYIKDKGFTTEIFKIEIQNLPKKFGIQVFAISVCTQWRIQDFP